MKTKPTTDLASALRWALEELNLGETLNPEGDPSPKHECEYKTNPEKGTCCFCDSWVSSQEALFEAEISDQPTNP